MRSRGSLSRRAGQVIGSQRRPTCQLPISPAAKLSPTEAWPSCAEPRRRSSLLRPTGAIHVETVAGIPFTVAPATVVRTVSGKRIGAALALRQLGDRTAVADCVSLVSPTNVYLAYLTPFRVRRGGPQIGRQYFVVGMEGIFRHSGSTIPSSSARVFSRMSPTASGSIPARISIAEARRS